MKDSVDPAIGSDTGPQAAASQLVDPQSLAWQATRFDGIEVKPLLFDRASGLATAMMRMAPGAVLPDHEHVLIEQTWVLEGHLVDTEGPDRGIECKAGQFIWRAAGSRHTAASPQGCVTLAMFQIPNKFHEPDGRVTDIAGVDWESLWGTARSAA